MSTFVLRNIDPAVWRRFKDRASAERMSQRTTLLRLIELYATCQIEAEEPTRQREIVAPCGCVFSGVTPGVATKRCARHEQLAQAAAATSPRRE